MYQKFTSDFHALYPIFVNKFFKKCMQEGSFNFIDGFFLSSILPYYTVYTLFLGIMSPLNWILAPPSVVLEKIMTRLLLSVYAVFAKALSILN